MQNWQRKRCQEGPHHTAATQSHATKRSILYSSYREPCVKTAPDYNSSYTEPCVKTAPDNTAATENHVSRQHQIITAATQNHVSRQHQIIQQLHRTMCQDSTRSYSSYTEPCVKTAPDHTAATQNHVSRQHQIIQQLHRTMCQDSTRSYSSYTEPCVKTAPDHTAATQNHVSRQHQIITAATQNHVLRQHQIIQQLHRTMCQDSTRSYSSYTEPHDKTAPDHTAATQNHVSRQHQIIQQLHRTIWQNTLTWSLQVMLTISWRVVPWPVLVAMAKKSLAIVTSSSTSVVFVPLKTFRIWKFWGYQISNFLLAHVAGASNA